MKNTEDKIEMQEDQNRERRSMNFGDWCNGAVNVVVGLLLGSVCYGLMQLFTTGAWAIAIIIFVGVGAFFLLELGIGRFFNWLFPSGIRASRKNYAKPKAPLIRVLSLPLGAVFGAILAHLDVGISLLELLP